MFLTLLVPLDRSTFAEQALPLALSIARRANARLDLVEVHALYALEDRHTGWYPFEPDREAECKQQEQLYLDATAKWLTSISRVPTITTLIPGSTVLPETVADGILERVRYDEADLIVMATHGGGFLQRFGSGSVARELVRRCSAPILLVKAGEEVLNTVPEPVLKEILIPLDGSALAEQILEPAVHLARLMEARCSLLWVIEAESSASDDLRADQARAEAYLEGIAAKIREPGLQVRKSIHVARHVAEAILEKAKVQASDLIAVTTHARGGLKRLFLGSVTDELIRGASCPILVCRPRGKDPGSSA